MGPSGSSGSPVSLGSSGSLSGSLSSCRLPQMTVEVGCPIVTVSGWVGTGKGGISMGPSGSSGSVGISGSSGKSSSGISGSSIGSLSSWRFLHITEAVDCVGHGNGGGISVGPASRFPQDRKPDGLPIVISSLCCGGSGSGSSSSGMGSSVGVSVGVGVSFGVGVGVAFFELVCGFLELGFGFGLGS
jgi:hypothetical protein